MIIIGADYHPGFQQIASVDTDTGEFQERRLHRICQLIWLILNKGVRYEERDPAVCEQSKRVRTSRMIRTLRKLGYRVELQADPA
jgi:hypothetical protein